MAHFPVVCTGNTGATFNLQSAKGQQLAVDFYSGHRPKNDEPGHVDLALGENHGSFTSRLGMMKFFYFGPAHVDSDW